MGLISKLIKIAKCKENHFIYIDGETYKKWKYLIKLVVLFNKNYKGCEIWRKEWKYLRNFVVIGLKWNGKNVKRRTKGFAKEYLSELKYVPNCLYCESELNYENATTDHIVPVCDGGTNTQVNLVVCCFNCNNERGDEDFYTYLRYKNKNWKNIKHPFI